MKRSDVNTILREGNDFIRSFGYVLPPFADWTPDAMRKARDTAPAIFERRLGWGLPKFIRYRATVPDPIPFAAYSIEFELERDIDISSQDVRDKVASIRADLPPEIDMPEAPQKLQAPAVPFIGVRS